VTEMDVPTVYAETTASIRIDSGISTLIDVTVVGADVDKTSDTLSPVTNVAPVASPAMVVAEVKV